ncbi:MAG: cell division protein SepF, partial [Okeania sp. SIO2H7]|nr:cell division protein SepF [Okeania sp. SIO2H7]
MSNIFGKLKDFVGLNDPAEYEYEYDEMDGDEYQNLYQEENGGVVQEEEQPQRRSNRRTA